MRTTASDSQETLELLAVPAWGLEDAVGRADEVEEATAGAAHEDIADEAAGGQASAHQATPLAIPLPPDKPPPTPVARPAQP